MFLKKHYRGRKNLVGVEVGVFAGKNAVDILKYLPIKKLYLVDSYRSTPPHSQKELDDAKIKALYRLRRFGDRIVWINESSDTAHKKIQEELDFVYIDADHRYEFAKRDMENYYPLLKENGVLAGHDIVSSWKGVLFALADFVRERNLSYRISVPDWIIVKKND